MKIVEHVHSAHGKRAYDEHDSMKDRLHLAGKDGKVYAERRAKGFPITWESLI